MARRKQVYDLPTKQVYDLPRKKKPVYGVNDGGGVAGFSMGSNDPAAWRKFKGDKEGPTEDDARDFDDFAQTAIQAGKGKRKGNAPIIEKRTTPKRMR